MVSPTKRTLQLSAAFLEIAGKYTAPGWIEYLLWETVEGLRDRPFKLLDPLSPEEMSVLLALRDEAQIWFFWQEGNWAHCAISDWREHASNRSADEVRRELEFGQ